MVLGVSHMTSCCHCGQATGPRYYSLDQKVERISSVVPDARPGQAEASLTYSVEVDSSLELERYCDASCWHAVEAARIQEYAIRYPYPEQHGLTATCSRCGLAFLATHPYVALDVMELMLHEQPWFTTAEVHVAETLARFCPDCEPPDALLNTATAMEQPQFLEALS